MWLLRSLRWRLTLFYAVLLLILLAALGSFVYLQLGHFLVDTTANRLNYQVLARVTLPRNDGRGPLTVQEAVHALDDQLQTLITDTTAVEVFNPQGQLVPTNNSIQSFSFPNPTSKDFNATASSRSFYYYTTNVPQVGSVVVVIVPVNQQQLMQPRNNPPNPPPPASQQITCFVVVAQSLTETSDILNQLRLILLFGSLAAIVIILLFGLPIARLGLRPLNRMAATARQIATGDLSQRVLLRAGDKRAKQDEIGQLAVAFNQMLDQIETAFAALRQSESRTRRFVADASHELRSPLTTLGGSLDVLMMQAKNNPAQAEKLMATMRREVDRMSRLVVDLLQLARLDADGSQSFEFVPLRLDKLAAEVCDDFQLVAGEHYLRCQLPPEEVWVRGDADRLRQVLTNLVDNALRYTPADGTITISVSVEQPNNEEKVKAVLQVQDTGAGIAPEHLPRIFDRFYRVDPSRTRASGHAGLGLAIVQALVESHGGTIAATSQPGQGTTFTIHLPLLLKDDKDYSKPFQSDSLVQNTESII